VKSRAAAARRLKKRGAVGGGGTTGGDSSIGTTNNAGNNRGEHSAVSKNNASLMDANEKSHSSSAESVLVPLNTVHPTRFPSCASSCTIETVPTLVTSTTHNLQQLPMGILKKSQMIPVMNNNVVTPEVEEIVPKEDLLSMPQLVEDEFSHRNEGSAVNNEENEDIEECGRTENALAELLKEGRMDEEVVVSPIRSNSLFIDQMSERVATWIVTIGNNLRVSGGLLNNNAIQPEEA
jgi:hypothetical protein